MKFKNITTGVVLEATSEFVIAQLKSNPNYEEVKTKTETKKTDKKSE